MEFVSEVRGKMTYLVIGGFLLGVIISLIWEIRIFETLFYPSWLDWLVAIPIFFVGVLLLERQIGKICRVIEEELRKRGNKRTTP